MACHNATRSTAGRGSMALPAGAARLCRRAKFRLGRATTAEVLRCVRVRREEKNREEEDDKLGPLVIERKREFKQFLASRV